MRVEVCGGQRWFKFWTTLRVTGYFILRYWAYFEIWVRMGVEACSYVILNVLSSAVLVVCVVLFCYFWLLFSSVGRILYIELCFRNAYVMWLSKKNVDLIFHCLEVGGSRIPEFVTKRGMLVWIWPREKFCYSRGIFYCLVFQPFLFWLPVELFFFYSSQLVQG